MVIEAFSRTQTHTFTYSRGKTWHRLVYALCLACFAVLAASRQLASDAFVIGQWLPTLLLCGLGLVAFRGWFDRRPVLTIGPEGIWFIKWPSKQPVAWAQVQHIALRDIGKGGPLVCVYLHGDKEVRTQGIPPHAFGTGLLDVSAPDAAKLATAFWSAASA